MLINASTKQALDSFCRHPAHALLISGSKGAGKSYVAHHIAAHLLQTGEVSTYPYFLDIPAADMNIEAVRKVKTFLSKKTTGTEAIRRVVVLHNVDNLGDAGQNALLKSIEEPPADTVLILTADDVTMVLPTILSRAAQLPVQPVEISAAIEYFGDRYDKDEITRQHLISKGLAGALNRQLAGEEDFEQAAALAKTLLRGSRFDRLAMIEELTKGKVASADVLHAMEIAVSVNFHKTLSTHKTTDARRLHGILTSLQLAQKQLAAKVNAKLVLTRLFLEM